MVTGLFVTVTFFGSGFVPGCKEANIDHESDQVP